MKKKVIVPDILPAVQTKCKIRAYRDFVFCKPITERIINGIVIPEVALDLSNPIEAIVVAVGCGLVEGGQIVPLIAKVGDRVFLPANAGTLIKVKETDEEFFVCRENILFGAVMA